MKASFNFIVLLVSLVILYGNISLGQYKGAVIKGTITDSRTGQLLTGANVMILGTDIGTATNDSGFYLITGLSPGTYVLKITI